MARSIWIYGAGAAAMVLAACGGRGEAPDAATDPASQVEAGVEAPVKPAAAAAPEQAMFIPGEQKIGEERREDGVYSARILWPEGLDTQVPDLAARLRADALAEFKQTKTWAEEAKAEGSEYFRAYEYEVAYFPSGQSGDLISLGSSVYIDAGGAHPNHYMGGVLYDRAAKTMIGAADMFTDSPAAIAAIRPVLLAQLTEQKAERYGVGADNATMAGETADALGTGGGWIANAWPVPSTEEGKFGGLIVRFSPYDIGAYAEGGYDAVIAQSVFKDALSAQYADLFAGEPDIDFGE